ncbi:MAG: glutamate-5-semialdehyde dehydrogenase [Gammaproteobacteria bacterium]|nr:glutamate-5-semialdehyde dehydrogenase [Gammaproteobacteria bacterium]
MKHVINQIKTVKKASSGLALLEDALRKKVLNTLAGLLRQSIPELVRENAKDLKLMPKDDPKYDRLLLTEKQINGIADDVERVASLTTPLGSVLEQRVMPNGLELQKITVPLGVVAVIYESRPNVTIDVFSLCFKAGNACILKGGKEAEHSNIFLVSLIHQALQRHEINLDAVYLLPPEREVTQVLLEAVSFVDVCIPRGSQALINYVREHAKIPVIETGAGIVHTYFDCSGSVQKGRLIIDNAKTRRVSVCNALDTLIIHEKCLDKLFHLVELLADKNVELFADAPSHAVLKTLYPEHLLHQAKAEDFGIEFLSYKMSIKTVASVDDAVRHIMNYTSGHSEAIIAEDKDTINYFMNHVDAAVLYVNASTAFTDGGQFGMGAEIGISTQKLHARGPMGLSALTSYKWLVFGDGQVRT